MASGRFPAGTVAGESGASSPAASTENCDTVPVVSMLVTYSDRAAWAAVGAMSASARAMAAPKARDRPCPPTAVDVTARRYSGSCPGVKPGPARGAQYAALAMQRRRRLGGPILAAGVAIALVAASPAHATIRPQIGMAGVRLHMTAQQVRAVLGAPLKVHHLRNDFGRYTEYLYPHA